MEEAYSRIIIYSCLIFGSGILCDRKLERRQAGSFCSENSEDNFYCSNGLCIELSWICDGHKDCSDGSDENKELCANGYGRNMTMDCGKVKINNQVILEGGKNKATVETAPWFVAIFQLYDVEYQFICVGSIIAPNLVISAAKPFWKMFAKQLSIKDGLFKISVGKYDRNFSAINNDFTQIMDVEMIYVPQDYNGEESELHADDISVLILANKVSFRNGITPLCIDWYSKYKENNGNRGQIFNWGYTTNGKESPVLLERFLPYINSSTCRRMYFTKRNAAYVTYDKFCAGPILKSEDVNTGAGISFLHSNSYFLTGVLGHNHFVNKTAAVPGFTDIKLHAQWIRGLLKKHATVNSCVLPIVEGVIYSYEGSNDILSHGILIHVHRNVIENCELGYHKAYTNSFRYCLGKGKWLSNFEKLCFKMCPPLESDSLDIKCSHNGDYANCSNLSIPGTIAIPSCKPTYYAALNGQEETPLELRCQPNGMWNKQLYNICKPTYCGRTYVKSEPLIGNGKKALVGTAPWNVGIYRLNRKNSNYEMICGGSVIAPNLVISAAHCFWTKDSPSKVISINDGLYKIAVGKYDRNFTIIDNEFTQIMNVEMIYVHEGYYGSAGFYADDIAFIVLPNRLSFSNGVAPVCIDWTDKYNVVSGDQGKVVGWGRTEKDIPSPILLEVSLPYINYSSCRHSFTDGFEPFVTLDKFCAGSRAGQGVNRGDSGAGLCFLHQGSYYLTGVVSIKEPNSYNSIAVFTGVKHHMQWISRLFKKYN